MLKLFMGIGKGQHIIIKIRVYNRIEFKGRFFIMTSHLFVEKDYI